MPPGMEVGLGPGNIVLDGDPAPPWKGAQKPHPTFRTTLLWHGRLSQQLLSTCLKLKEYHQIISCQIELAIQSYTLNILFYGRPTGHGIVFCSCGYFLSSSFVLFPRLFSADAGWMSTILPRTRRGLSANLECRSEMCYTRLAENTGRKNTHLRTIAQLCRAIGLSSQLTHVLTIGKTC